MCASILNLCVPGSNLGNRMIFFFLIFFSPGRVAQSIGHMTRKSGVLGSIPGLATYFRFSFRFSRRAVVSYWRKYVHEVLVNRLGGLSLPRKSVVRLTDRPDMTVDVYRRRKTTIQFFLFILFFFNLFIFLCFLSLLLQCKFANSTLLSLLSFSYFITPYDAQASSAFSALIIFLALAAIFFNGAERFEQFW